MLRAPYYKIAIRGSEILKQNGTKKNRGSIYRGNILQVILGWLTCTLTFIMMILHPFFL